MTTISPTPSPGWKPSSSVHINSARSAGSSLLLLTLLFLFVSFALQGTFDFPKILLDSTSTVNDLLVRNRGILALSFLGLLLCGIVQVIVARGLMPSISISRRRLAFLAPGIAGGSLW